LKHLLEIQNMAVSWASCGAASCPQISNASLWLAQRAKLGMIGSALGRTYATQLKWGWALPFGN